MTVTLDLESIAEARAATQLASVRLDVDEPDSWEIAGPPTAAVSTQRRRRCWACDRRAEVQGYCRKHREQIRNAGVVDPLHIAKREGGGAPKGGRFA